MLHKAVRHWMLSITPNHGQVQFPPLQLDIHEAQQNLYKAALHYVKPKAFG